MVQNFEPQNLHSRKTKQNKTKQNKTKHLSITYIDFPRKCDPLIYTYQSARFIFFFHEIFVNFSNFFWFYFVVLFLFFYI